MGEKLDLVGVMAAYWAAVTSTIALVAIVPALYSIRAQLDPFEGTRGKQHLGVWANPTRPWALTRPPPQGPVIEASLHTCLGCDTIYLSGRPLPGIGVPSWILFLRKFHAANLKSMDPSHFSLISHFSGRLGNGLAPKVNNSRNVRDETTNLVSSGKTHPSEEHCKKELKRQTLVMCNGMASTTIDSTTLIVFILLSQMTVMYKHEGPMGLCVIFVGYTGKLRVKSAMETIVEYEEYRDMQKSQSPYPFAVPRKPRDCVHMGLGIVDRFPEDKVAFDDRRPNDGKSYVMMLQRKGYHAQDYVNDVYDLMGGSSIDVDFLLFEPVDDHQASAAAGLYGFNAETRSGGYKIYLDKHMLAIIADCLDKLPWSVLGWSIHKGMKDVLLGFASAWLDLYREELAVIFRHAATTYADKLIEKEWNEGFVRMRVPDIVGAAFDGRLKSGNVCRVIAAVAEEIWEHGLPTIAPDQQQQQQQQQQSRPSAESITKSTRFWKEQLEDDGSQRVYVVAPVKKSLKPDGIVALTKAFFLRCSHEFDYRVFHLLPQKLIMI